MVDGLSKATQRLQMPSWIQLLWQYFYLAIVRMKKYLSRAQPRWALVTSCLIAVKKPLNFPQLTIISSWRHSLTRNLWIEKAGHPEDGWTAGEAPRPELTVPLKQLSKPASFSLKQCEQSFEPMSTLTRSPGWKISMRSWSTSQEPITDNIINFKHSNNNICHTLASNMLSRTSLRSSLMMIVPSMAITRSVRVRRNRLNIRCIRSISCLIWEEVLLSIKGFQEWLKNST